MNALRTGARARYLRFARRERGLAVLAAVVLTIGLGEQILIEPVLKKRALLLGQIAAQQSERDTLQQHLAGTGRDPNAALRAQLDALQTQVRATDREFHDMQNGLVQPQHMGSLLQSLLTEHRGLQLLGLRSLPVTAIGEPGSGVAKKTASASASGVAASDTGSGPEAWLYRHAVEIRVQGNYADMLGYLQALETLPRRVHWGDLDIDARNSPANVMTVTLFTVSLERSWWVL